MRAGRMIVTNYSSKAIDRMLLELERGMFDSIPTLLPVDAFRQPGKGLRNYLTISQRGHECNHLNQLVLIS